MTARCGSNDPAHRSRSCRACDRIYKQRYRSGKPRDRFRLRSVAATCCMCNLTHGNSLGIGVYRYPLKKWSRARVRWVGSIEICDDCLARHGDLKEAA